MNHKKIILASASPRRQQLMKDAGFDFDIIKLDIDESFPDNLKGGEIPLYISQKKADTFKHRLKKDTILITADTIVWLNEKALNKPNDLSHAQYMLSQLSGRMHEVFTGVTLTTTSKQISFVAGTKVYFKKLSEDEMSYYVKNFHPLDKAGGYGVQDWIGLIGIEKIEGNYFNVMGLPIMELNTHLKAFINEV